MTRLEFTNKPGNYRVDNTEIFVFNDKIIVDTGSSQTRTKDDRAYAGKKPGAKKGAAKSKKPKEPTDRNPLDALSGARDFVLGNGKKGGGLFR